MDEQPQLQRSAEEAQRIVRESPGSVIPQDMRVVESLYDSEQVAWLPASVKMYALGLGNPIRYAELEPGEIVLDVGSGGGMNSFLAAKRVGPTGRVIGFDMTPEMIQHTQFPAETLPIYLAHFRFEKPL